MFAWLSIINLLNYKIICYLILDILKIHVGCKILRFLCFNFFKVAWGLFWHDMISGGIREKIRHNCVCVYLKNTTLLLLWLLRYYTYTSPSGRSMSRCFLPLRSNINLILKYILILILNHSWIYIFINFIFKCEEFELKVNFLWWLYF